MTIPTVPPSFEACDGETPTVHLVLVEPEIPPNTGNIARLAAGTDAWLHLVRPLGFELSSKHVRRAGLDYWPAVRLSVHASVEALAVRLPIERCWFFSKQGTALHTDVRYPSAPILVFGSESRGLPAALVSTHADRVVRIPTTSRIRSLNLSNAVAVATYEVLRQREWRGERPMPS